MVACARLLMEAATASAVVWLKVLGLMASMVDLIPMCRFHMRPTQLHLLAHYRPLTEPLSKPVPVSDIVRVELSWWSILPNLSVGMEFPTPPFTHVVTTDTSKTGWVSHLLDRQASGTWSPGEAVVSYINREGGTHSPTLCMHARQLLLWCQARDIVLKAIHIPGKTNILADELSLALTLHRRYSQ
jgi:hypothetical protein